MESAAYLFISPLTTEKKLLKYTTLDSEESLLRYAESKLLRFTELLIASRYTGLCTAGAIIIIISLYKI